MDIDIDIETFMVCWLSVIAVVSTLLLIWGGD